jgi:hypothetical protein
MVTFLTAFDVKQPIDLNAKVPKEEAMLNLVRRRKGRKKRNEMSDKKNYRQHFASSTHTYCIIHLFHSYSLCYFQVKRLDVDAAKIGLQYDNARYLIVGKLTPLRNSFTSLCSYFATVSRRL